MDLGGRLTGKSNVVHKIHKQVFQFISSRKDGLILQIHHTVPSANCEIRRVRFVLVKFDCKGEKLAAVDHRGNIFIVNLTSNKFWLLPNMGSCSVVEFSPYNVQNVVIGSNNCYLYFVNTELGTVTGELVGHTTPPTQISFASNSQYCLSASAEEGIIWDLKSNSQAHRLTMRTDVAVKKLVFMPISNNILACFQDDIMHVWRFETFECLKQIVPEAWKSHHLKTIAFTRDGRAMVIGGYTPALVVFALDNWSLRKVIDLPQGMPGVRHIEFLPQLFDGGANKILGLLSSDCTVHFLDIETSMFSTTVIQTDTKITKFACSNNGKYVACILRSGEVNIYSSAELFPTRKPVDSQSYTIEKAGDDPMADISGVRYGVQSMPGQIRHSMQEQMTHLTKQIKETLDLSRLKPILKEFGEYPESYRPLIWKTILQLPHNQSSYVALVNRDCHPAYLHLEKDYPLENKALLKNLKRLLSCLAHWSPLFAEVKYLPLLVFPFVKVFQNDPFICFEAVVTVIVNWCQHWFEYFPLAPVNVLAMIENVLVDHDPDLMEYFYSAGVTSQVYAWSLLENVFSEVLSPPEWLRLWDHILSNEPSFLLMVVVAYNTVCRTALKTCRTLSDFEFFYHNQNAIDMKKLLSKTYHLCENTKDQIHPRQYLRNLLPLQKGMYPAFNAYPKLLVDNHAHQIETIKNDEEEIMKEHLQTVDKKISQEKRIQEEKLAQIEEARLSKLEEAYRDTLHKEEERIAEHRKRIVALRQELRNREVALLEATKDRLMRQRTRQRIANLDRMQDEIKHKQALNDTNLAVTEEELRRHYAELLTNKLQLEQELGPLSHILDPGPSLEHQGLQRQQEQLTEELLRLREDAASSHHQQQINITSRIAQVDEMMQRIEMELAKEMADRQCNLQSGHNNLKALQLETETKALESEVADLLEQLTTIRLLESKAKMEEVIQSQVDRRRLNIEQHRLIGAPKQSRAQTQCKSTDSSLKRSSRPPRAKEHSKDRKNVSREMADQWIDRSHAARRLQQNTDNIGKEAVWHDNINRNCEAKKLTRSVHYEATTSSGVSLRSSDYYSTEQGAVQAAANAREHACSAARPADNGLLHKKK